jgi:hypothetical protein
VTLALRRTVFLDGENRPDDLPPEGRDDPEAVSDALYEFFDRALTCDANIRGVRVGCAIGMPQLTSERRLSV